MQGALRNAISSFIQVSPNIKDTIWNFLEQYDLPVVVGPHVGNSAQPITAQVSSVSCACFSLSFVTLQRIGVYFVAFFSKAFLIVSWPAYLFAKDWLTPWKTIHVFAGRWMLCRKFDSHGHSWLRGYHDCDTSLFCFNIGVVRYFMSLTSLFKLFVGSRNFLFVKNFGFWISCGMWKRNGNRWRKLRSRTMTNYLGNEWQARETPIWEWDQRQECLSEEGERICYS